MSNYRSKAVAFHVNTEVKRKERIPSGNTEEVKVFTLGKSTIHSLSDFVVVEPSTPLSKEVVVGPTEQKKLEDSSTPMMQLAKSLFNPKHTYAFRIVGDLVTATAPASITTTLKVANDPTSTAEFAILTGLFGEYRVEHVHQRIWMYKYMLSDASPQIFLVGSDPAGVITGTPTATTIGSLADTERYNANQTSKYAIGFDVKGVKDCVLNLAPSKDGFISVAVSWPGQTCMLSQASASSSATMFVVQTEWVVSFRARG